MPAFALFNKKNVVAIILLSVITLLVYLPVLGHQLLNWDDPVHLTANINVKAFDTTHLIALFKTRINDIYIPLTTLSFSIEHHFFGLNPFVFHLNNLLLHIVTVILVFIFLRQLDLTFAVSLGAALIFAIHPSRVESVAWVTERKDVLYASLYVGACICYLRGRLGLCWVLGFLSMLAKPMALSLPLILLLLDWYKGKRINFKAVLSKWPFVLMVVLIGAITYVHHARVPFSQVTEAPLIFIWTAMFYLRQFMAPMLALPVHLLPEPVSLFNLSFAFSIGLLFLVIAGVWVLRRQRLVIFAVMFVILSMFFLWRFDHTQDTNMVAERFMYLPALGFCILIALCLEWVYEFLKGQESVIRMLFIVAVVALLSGLCVLTFQQTKVWHDTQSLWRHQIKYAPNAIAYNNLAETNRVLSERDNAATIDLYRKAISADLTHNPIYTNNLAGFYKELGEYAKGEQLYVSALTLDKSSKDAYFGLAAVYQLEGETSKAIGVYNQLIKLYPDDEDVYINVIEAYGKAIEASPQVVVLQEKREELLAAFEQLSTRKKYTAVDFYNLGFLYQQVGAREDAMRYYSKALGMQSNYAQAMYNLANLYQEAGDLKTAMIIYQRLVHAHPQFAAGHLNMGVIFNSLGDHERAKQCYLKVIQIDPNNSRAYFNLGYLSEVAGNFQEAINYYEKAIDCDSINAEAYYNLGNVYAHLGQSPEAVAMYLKTAGVDPKHQNAYVNLSILSFKLRDFKGAIQYLEQAQSLGYNAPAEYLKTLELYRKNK